MCSMAAFSKMGCIPCLSDAMCDLMTPCAACRGDVVPSAVGVNAVLSILTLLVVSVAVSMFVVLYLSLELSLERTNE